VTLLVPVSWSAMTQMSSCQLGGLMMGAWFLVFRHVQLCGRTGRSATEQDGWWVIAGYRRRKAKYEAVYSQQRWRPSPAGVVMFLLSPVLKKLMHGEKLILPCPTTPSSLTTILLFDGTATAQVVLPPISEWNRAQRAPYRRTDR